MAIRDQYAHGAACVNLNIGAIRSEIEKNKAALLNKGGLFLLRRTSFLDRLARAYLSIEPLPEGIPKLLYYA